MEILMDFEYAEALSEVLEEWGSENDEEAYRNLGSTTCTDGANK